MEKAQIEEAASKYGNGQPSLEKLGHGLIHHTYKVSFSHDNAIVLQSINQSTFPQPNNIIRNYRLMQDWLRTQNNGQIAELVKTKNGEDSWTDEAGNFWRATRFIQNSYASSIPGSAEEVFLTARSFARFTRSLAGLRVTELSVTIPDFHNLEKRYEQFEVAVKKAAIGRLLKSTHVISEARERFRLVDFYREVAATETEYPTRIMHHDCKISNILFDKATREVICPVDLDTVMPGKFFSDIGDMIRTMACTEEENSTAWENIGVKEDYYRAIVNGYLAGIGDNLTEKEKEHIHQSGLIITYMQCLRFLTDFLNNDIYYQTTYPEQNLNRALNQLILLEKLEEFV